MSRCLCVDGGVEIVSDDEVGRDAAWLAVEQRQEHITFAPHNAAGKWVLLGQQAKGEERSGAGTKTSM